MIDSIEFDYTGSKPEVFFRWRNLDWAADLDPGVVAPVVIRGSAECYDVAAEFTDYAGLQQAINKKIGK